MYNTSNLVLVSLLIVVAIIAVGSLLFINTRREERPRLNIPQANPVLPIIDSTPTPTPTPTPNQQVMIETNPSLFPTSIVTKIASRTQSPAPVLAPTKAPAPAKIQNNKPKPVTTSQVSSTPNNIDGNNDNVIEESNNPAAVAIEVYDLTVREVQRYNDNQLLDNYVKAAIYVQQLYDMKARTNWVLDETDSLNYIPRTINNLRLLSNELRIRGIISELDFYKVLSYAEVYYRCTNDPSHIQCREGYEVDNELPSRYYPEYHNLNYTFSRYVNEIVNPEISKLRRVNRRYMVKYIQLRTAQDEREHLNRINVNEATRNENQNQANNNSGNSANNAPAPANNIPEPANNNRGNNALAPANNNSGTNTTAPVNNNTVNTANNSQAPVNNNNGNSGNNTPAPANNNSGNNMPALSNNNSGNNSQSPANNNSANIGNIANNTPAPANNNRGNNTAPGPISNNTPPQQNASPSPAENETPSPAPSGSGLNGNPV